MSKNWYLALLSGALLFLPGLARAATTTGTIDTFNKYAWSERAGWINFLPTGGDITITDSAITGYAWSPNSGWINLSPTTSGVTNDGEGNLSGYAWGEGLGWIDFSGVTIDQNGYFHGYASSTVTGRINFNCDDTSSCSASDFKVRTNWRSNTTNLPTALSNTPLTFTTTSIDLPSSGRILTTTTLSNTSNAHVILPRAVTARQADGSLFTGSIAIPVAKAQGDLPKAPPSATNYVSAIDVDTGGGSVTFDKNITITLPIPTGSSRKNIRINYFDTNGDSYRLAGDGGTVANDGESISVQVDHLTTFVVMADTETTSAGNNFSSGSEGGDGRSKENTENKQTTNALQPVKTITPTTPSPVVPQPPKCTPYISAAEAKNAAQNTAVIKKIQSFLGVKASGTYGSLTKNAVRAFQETYTQDILLPAGLQKGTGTAGPLTIAKINQLKCAKEPAAPVPPTAPTKPSLFKKNLKLGMSDPDILTLQKILNANGFLVATSGPGSPGQEISAFGVGTQKALAQFQKKNKITPANGFFGSTTRSVVLKMIETSR